MKTLIACFMILGLVACKEKHKSLSGEETVDIKEFLEVFPKLSLPYKIADTSLSKAADTTLISYTVFKEFIPDSVLERAFGKNLNTLKIHPVGKIEKEKDIYLLADFTQKRKTTLVVFLLDDKNKYHADLLLLKQENMDEYVHSISVTSEPTFILSREKMNAKNELSYTRNGYAYNEASGSFIAVMNDSNEDLKRINEVINPIDTFPEKNKFSGDYVQDKKNFISVRDGNNPGKYAFFIHFEKEGGCSGELKGIMTMRDATHAYYQESGDPCVIDFVLSNKRIVVKEEGNCGNHRGIKCFFDDSYKKKKETGSKK